MGLPKYQWKEIDEQYPSFYYFETTNGLIVGMTHRIGHTSVYLAKIIEKNEELVLGRYISQDYAKMAIENYYFIKSQTLIEN
jgi:hypothetical protein